MQKCKYLIDNHNNTDKIGVSLALIYLFTSYLANDVILSSSYNKVFFYLFLAYGMLTTFCKIIQKEYKLSFHSVWYIIFLTVCFFTTLYSRNVNALDSGMFRSVIICFVVTFFLSEFIFSEKAFKYVGWSYIYSSVLMIVILMARGRMVGTEAERLGKDLFGNSNIFATFMMYSAVFSVWNLIYGSLWEKRIAFPCLLLEMYALVLSAGRKFFIVPFLFFYFLFFFKGIKKGNAKLVKYTIIMAVIVIVTYNIIMRIPVFYNSIGIRLQQLLEQYTGGKGADFSSTVRAEMRSAAIEEWGKSPLFGYGFDSFRYFKVWQTPEGPAQYYSHCNYTELLYNGGIIQFGVYYSLFLICICKLFKSQYNQYTAFSFAALISQFVFDYGCVSYETISMQIFILLSVISMDLGIKMELGNKEVTAQ